MPYAFCLLNFGFALASQTLRTVALSEREQRLYETAMSLAQPLVEKALRCAIKRLLDFRCSIQNPKSKI